MVDHFRNHVEKNMNGKAKAMIVGNSRANAVRYCLEVRKFLEERGYSSKEMIEAGLLKPSTRGTEPYAFFRGRVTFPVIDRRSRVVAFGGRILPEHMRPPSRSDFTPPKYINSSETVLFHKGQMLYGEPQARRAAADGQKLLAVLIDPDKFELKKMVDKNKYLLHIEEITFDELRLELEQLKENGIDFLVDDLESVHEQFLDWQKRFVDKTHDFCYYCKWGVPTER